MMRRVHFSDEPPLVTSMMTMCFSLVSRSISPVLPTTRCTSREPASGRVWEVTARLSNATLAASTLLGCPLNFILEIFAQTSMMTSG